MMGGEVATPEQPVSQSRAARPLTYWGGGGREASIHGERRRRRRRRRERRERGRERAREGGPARMGEEGREMRRCNTADQRAAGDGQPRGSLALLPLSVCVCVCGRTATALNGEAGDQNKAPPEHLDTSPHLPIFLLLSPIPPPQPTRIRPTLPLRSRLRSSSPRTVVFFDCFSLQVSNMSCRAPLFAARTCRRRDRLFGSRSGASRSCRAPGASFDRLLTGRPADTAYAPAPPCLVRERDRRPATPSRASSRPSTPRPPSCARSPPRPRRPPPSRPPSPPALPRRRPPPRRSPAPRPRYVCPCRPSRARCRAPSELQPRAASSTARTACARLKCDSVADVSRRSRLPPRRPSRRPRARP
jgi:hypothetical protein